MLSIVNIKKHCPKYFLVFIFIIDSLLSLFLVVAFKRTGKTIVLNEWSGSQDGLDQLIYL